MFAVKLARSVFLNASRPAPASESSIRGLRLRRHGRRLALDARRVATAWSTPAATSPLRAGHAR